jgi:hypothetical protein
MTHTRTGGLGALRVQIRNSVQLDGDQGLQSKKSGTLLIAQSPISDDESRQSRDKDGRIVAAYPDFRAVVFREVVDATRWRSEEMVGNLHPWHSDETTQGRTRHCAGGEGHALSA